MPEPKRPLKVFLCHASMDKPKVRELYRYLKKRGIQPWFDEEDLVGGQDWQVEIPKALATSDAIIICLTKNSVDKEGYIQKEIKFALDKALEMPEGRIFLIPVKFEECEVPYALSRYHWVDLTFKLGYSKMLKALKFRAADLERSPVGVSKKALQEKRARLQEEQEDRRKIAKEKAERQAAYEAAEKEAVELTRLKIEEEERNKIVKEKEAAEQAALLRDKFNKVIQLERSGYLEDALNICNEIKAIDPEYPGIEKKIQEIQSAIKLRDDRKKEEERQRIAKEKTDREAAEKARLIAEEEERKRIAREKAEREAAEKAAREKAEKEAAELATLLYGKLNEAIKLERSGYLEEALSIYHDIKSYDSQYPNIEKRIRNLEKAISEVRKKDADEKTRLKAEEEERQRIANERAAREKVEAEKTRQEKEILELADQLKQRNVPNLKKSLTDTVAHTVTSNINGRPLKIVLSYSRNDQAEVQRLKEFLSKTGADVWLDSERILPGENWEKAIRNAVREADAVIFCISKHFSQSLSVKKEVRYILDIAAERPKGSFLIIPAKFEECEVIENLKEWHWIDLFKYDGYENLIRGLRSLNVQAIPKAELYLSPEITSRFETLKPPSPAFRKLAKSKLLLNVGVTYFLLFVFAATVMTVVVLAILNGQSIDSPNTALIEISVTSTSTDTIEPSPTITSNSNSTLVNMLTPTPLPTEITDTKGLIMRLIPAGEFTMGSENGDKDEQPIHQVYLDAFYIDIYEVTNAAYKACEDAGKCNPPHETHSIYLSSYYGSNTFPVIYIDWNQAIAYCEWRGSNLPTEAQWEKAARGTDGRTYPWGEDIDCDKAMYGGCVANTTRVGSYESGKSPYGIYDLAGNVWEWVADRYDYAYYQSSPKSNPLGPNSGQYRVIRGGSWGYDDYNLRSANRSLNNATNFSDTIGFRCAKDVTP